MDRARDIHAGTFPVIRAMGRVGGAIFAKAAMRLRGIDVGDPRLPLVPATAEQTSAIAADLAEAGVALGAAVRRRSRTGEPRSRLGGSRSGDPSTVRQPNRPAVRIRPPTGASRTGPSCRSRTRRRCRPAGLRVVALGGIGEIGRNMTVFEYDGQLLVVDCGVLFPPRTPRAST